MFKRKQVSNTSWIILEGNKPFGFLKATDDLLTFMVGTEKFVFSSHKELEQHFGKIIDIEPTTNETAVIKGFPSRHKGTIQEVPNDKYPTYNTGGNVVFVAGFFALKFSNSKIWQVVHSPKLATIELNTAIGPFKTRLEALNEVSMNNRKIEDEKSN